MSDKPAASETNSFALMGGAWYSLFIGSHLKSLDRNPAHTDRSSFASLEIVTKVSGFALLAISARHWLIGCLKTFIRGHN
jgi:hypothetical protein